MNDLKEPERDAAYNFAYLDEQTKRMIRRALLKAVAIPVDLKADAGPFVEGLGDDGKFKTGVAQRLFRLNILAVRDGQLPVQ